MMKILQHTRIKKPLCLTRAAGRLVNGEDEERGRGKQGSLWWEGQTLVGRLMAGGSPDPRDIDG